jgi:ABC-type multidrug transport system fused ATPase/permease subunit
MKTGKQIWDLLQPTQRRSAAVLLCLMLVGMLLETLGIGLIIPAFAFMTQSDLVVRYPRVMPAAGWVGHLSRGELVVIGMLVLVAVYALKALFLAFLFWRQMGFVYGVQAEISHRLFAGYLRQPYIFHLQRNSAELIRNALTETNLFTQTCLVAGMGLLTEMLVVVGISALLVVVAPLGALVVVGILGTAAWVFNRVTHQRLLRWGAARQLHEGLRIQHLQQGLGGAKDVKLLGREQEFLAHYHHHNLGNARVGQQYQTLQQFPRLGLELLAVCGLAALVIVMVAQNKPVTALLPTLGLFAAAAFRVLPSANRVMIAVQNVRFALPAINVLHGELRVLKSAEEPAAARQLEFQEYLALDNVSFCYPSSDRPALQGISLTVSRGASVGFIGESGAGKSTLVDIILGLLQPGRGAVRVDGADIRTNLRGWQDQVGYVPQAIFLTDDTLRRNVAFGLADDQISEYSVWSAVRAAQLEEFIKSLPQGLDTMVGERGVRLSGGQLQRVGIARALYHNPAVLVLDEATSSLDTQTERGVMDAVRKLHGEKTIIVVAHRMSTVEDCDQLVKLEDGRIVSQGDAESMLGRMTSAS